MQGAYVKLPACRAVQSHQRVLPSGSAWEGHSKASSSTAAAHTERTAQRPACRRAPASHTSMRGRGAGAKGSETGMWHGSAQAFQGSTRGYGSAPSSGTGHAPAAAKTRHGRGGATTNRGENSPKGKVTSPQSQQGGSQHVNKVGQRDLGMLGSPAPGCLAHGPESMGGTRVLTLAVCTVTANWRATQAGPLATQRQTAPVWQPSPKPSSWDAYEQAAMQAARRQAAIIRAMAGAGQTGNRGQTSPTNGQGGKSQQEKPKTKQ